MTSEPVLIRNFNLMKSIIDNLDVLSTYYKLKQRDIDIIQTLLMKHNTYNAYIQIKTNQFTEPRRTVYRGLDNLENKNILTVIERPVNQHDFLKVYFTVDFIYRVCGDEAGELYERWLEWQKDFQ